MASIKRRIPVQGVAAGSTASIVLPTGAYRYRRILLRFGGTVNDVAVTLATALATGPNAIEVQLQGKTVRSYSAGMLWLEMALYNNQQRGFATGYSAPQNIGVIQLIEATFDRTLYAPGLNIAATLPREGDSLAWGTGDITELTIYLRLAAGLTNGTIDCVVEYDPIVEPIGAIVGLRYSGLTVSGATENQTLTLPGGSFSLMSILMPSTIVTAAELLVGSTTQYQTDRGVMQAFQGGNFYTGLPFSPYDGAINSLAFIIDLCADRSLEDAIPMAMGGRARTDIILRPTISNAGTVPVGYRVYGEWSQM
jgi:hypothetical protein